MHGDQSMTRMLDQFKFDTVLDVGRAAHNLPSPTADGAHYVSIAEPPHRAICGEQRRVKR